MRNPPLKFRDRLLQMTSVLVFVLSVLSAPTMAATPDMLDILGEGYHAVQHSVMNTQPMAEYGAGSDDNCLVDMIGDCAESDGHQHASHGWHSGHCFDGITNVALSGEKARTRPTFLLVFDDALISRAPDNLQRPPNS